MVYYTNALHIKHDCILPMSAQSLCKKSNNRNKKKKTTLITPSWQYCSKNTTKYYNDNFAVKA